MTIHSDNFLQQTNTHSDKGGASYEASMEYFRTRFSGIEVDSDLLTDYQDDPIDDRIEKYTAVLPISIQAAEAFLRAAGVTEGTLFMGAFAYALAKFTGQSESLFCAVESGMHDADLEESTGMPARILPIYARIDEQLSPADYLKSVQDDFFELIQNGGVSFDDLCRESGLRPDIFFVYQAQMFNGLSTGGTLKETDITDAHAATANLRFMVFRRKDGYTLALDYRPAMYKPDTIRRFADAFGAILSGMFSSERMSEIHFTSDADFVLLRRFNDTDRPIDENTSLVELLRAQARKTPDNPAIVFEDKTYTYRQYDEWTDQIALAIRKRGVGRGDFVAILMPRCALMTLAAIGVLKSGAAYQPLDATYPPERLNYMVKDSSAKLLIISRDLACLLDGYAGEILYADELDSHTRVEGTLDTPVGSDAFVLLYTSGTTGKPKGCVLEHHNLVNFCKCYVRGYELDEHSRVAAYASFGFDANMLDTYPTLISGGTLYILSEEIRMDMDALDLYFTRCGISHCLMTTQIGRQFALRTHCPSLRYLFVGGEKLVPIQPPEHFSLYNMYGPTECTIVSTGYRVIDDCARQPIGKPFDNLRLYVADAQGRILPVGVPGELLIAGEQVGRGYLNNPEQTRKAFISNPYDTEKKYARMYRTGDIVRWLPDGNIEFIGRRDGQVKIRGFRVELTEVERVIRDFPGVEDATVIAKDSPSGEKKLVAYVVSDGKLDTKALGEFILREKPPYMLPAVIMQLDQIPLNFNGKVDKRKLPEPALVNENKSERTRTQLEQQLFAIAKDVLGSDEFDVDMELTTAGLSSISVIKFAHELQMRFNYSPDVKQLLGHASILSVENQLVDHLMNQGTLSQPVTQARTERYPLTQSQLGIYFECKKDETSDKYQIPMVFRLGSDSDLDRLERSIRAAIEAHPSVKCKIAPDPECGAVMVAQDALEWDIARINISESEWNEKIRTEHIVFGLEEPPLFAIRLVRTEQNVYLEMNFHHIIMDGTSVSVLMRDIERAYEGEKLKTEVYSSFDLALDEQTARNGSDYAKAKAYYDSVFSDVSDCSLPNPDVFEQPQGRGTLKAALENVAQESVKRFCDTHNVTPNALFTAGFAYTLCKFTNKEEALFTSVYNGRVDPRTFDILGMLVKTYPVYVTLSSGISSSDFVLEIKKRVSKLIENDVFSFADVRRAYNIPADIIFVYQGDEFTQCCVAGQLVEMKEAAQSDIKAPLSFEVMQRDGHYFAEIEYDSGRYSNERIRRFADIYEMVIRGMLEEKTLGDIELTSPDALAFLEKINDTDWPVAVRPAHCLLEESAARFPNRTAVIAAGRRLNYEQLNALANRLAHTLIEYGIRPGDIVALMLPRSADVYIARQGIMKSGAAFLFIDPEYPDDRVLFMLSDSGAKRVIVTPEIKDTRADLVNASPAAVDTMDELIKNENEDNPGIQVAPDDLCYCIYTSGTTGKPKGVMLTQQGLVNFLDANPKNRLIMNYIKNTHVSLAMASFAFDMSVIEELFPLANGLTVCMAVDNEIHNAPALASLMQDNEVDMIPCTPSFLSNIIDMSVMRQPLSRIGCYLIGAEVFPQSLFDKIRAINPRACIMNCYGPTETTVCCTMTEVTDPRDITIGRALNNVKAYIVDDRNRILPPCVCGELVICGAGVGRGYIGRSDLTREKFISIRGLPAYKTGDLAEYTVRGMIQYHGRTDNQVKLRGLRIELGEIENAINAYPGVDTSIVTVAGPEDDRFLAAYFTSTEDVETGGLQDWLLKTLTRYMVPDVFIRLDAMPLNQNGKIDRKRLPEPKRESEKRTYIDPENEVESDFCALFAQILQLPRVGATEDFFELGGTSLSASRVAMFALEHGYKVVYGDVFKAPTPRKLAVLAMKTNNAKSKKAEASDIPLLQDIDKLNPLLAQNTQTHLDDIRADSLGDILLTGATGFLGIHVLRAFLLRHDGVAYCLMRKGRASSVEQRLKILLVYYFDKSFDEFFESGRICCVEGDMTDAGSLDLPDSLTFQTVLNCAADVRHFAADDSLERVNVRGVENLLEHSRRHNSRFIQVSTASVAGESVDGKPPIDTRLSEDEIYIGQTIENDYALSKFKAEVAVLSAANEHGSDVKIMRVGNLMARHKDGEFQINFRMNAFMRQLRGYKLIGAFPMSLMYTSVELSEIEYTADAILRLAMTPSIFTVFHPYNNHKITYADVVDAMRQYGFTMDIVSDDEFRRRLDAAIANPAISEAVGGLIAYMSGDEAGHRVELGTNCDFTTQALYRLDFKWPLTSTDYIRKAMEALDGLGMFDTTKG